MLLNPPQCPRQLPPSRVSGPLMSTVPRLRNRHLEADFGLAWGARLNKVQVASFHLSSVAPSSPGGHCVWGVSSCPLSRQRHLSMTTSQGIIPPPPRALLGKAGRLLKNEGH